MIAKLTAFAAAASLLATAAESKRAPKRIDVDVVLTSPSDGQLVCEAFFYEPNGTVVANPRFATQWGREARAWSDAKQPYEIELTYGDGVATCSAEIQVRRGHIARGRATLRR